MFKTGEDIVCVTGASGFVGSHVVDRLLEGGHKVRATVRDPKNAEKTAHLSKMAERHPGELTLCRGNLLEADSFDEAVAGCTAVIHTAAAALLAAKNPQAEIVEPSVQGVNNVLSAVRKAGTVRRLVQTSSAAALYSAPKQDKTYDESDWNEEATLKTDPYGMAKTQAERAAHAYAEESEGATGVVSINPVLVFGPVYTKAHVRSSVSVLRDLLVGTFPAAPQFFFNVVDARDVAEAHVRAATQDGLDGRFILSHKGLWMQEIAQELDRLCPEYRIKTGRLPNVAMYLAAIFDARLTFATLRQLLGREAKLDNRRSREVLGIEYMSLDQTLRDTVDSLVEQGFAQPTLR